VTTCRADTGAGNAGAIYSFGATGSSERALGSIASGTPGNFAYGVRLLNDTVQAVTNLTISYVGEQWRNGGNTAVQTLAFSYLISNSAITSSDAVNVNAWTAFTALDFNTPTVGATATALDGEADANRHIFSNVLLPNVVVFPGQEIFLRWFDLNDPGNDHALAIDDLGITFTFINPVTNAPAITREPQSRTNNAGTSASFTVSATGTALNYQWMKDGNNLYDGIKISGSTAATLTLSGVLDLDAGAYSVLVANSLGSVTSIVATLTVIDPGINTQPQDRTKLTGETGNFFVSAAGTIPLSYQWRFNGVDITDATANSLNVPNVQSTNQGDYSVAVGNVNGNWTTSAVAHLTLKPTPAIRLAQWDFNNTNTLSVTAPATSSGTGTASLLNGVTATFGTGTLSDPAGVPGSANSGWNTAGYPPQSTSNKTAGVQFNVSTLGYQNILLTWEQRHSNTAGKYSRLRYSIDGSTFIDGPLLTMTATNNSFVFYSANLSGVAGVDNNPNFAFAIVAEWEATAVGNTNSNYVGTVTSYSTGGTVRFDLVNAFGNVFSGVSPIPLQTQRAGSKVILTWANPAFSLQSAPVVSGPYTTLSGATSPFTNSFTGSQQYFRLKY
jgi:hypothetical protein